MARAYVGFTAHLHGLWREKQEQQEQERQELLARQQGRKSNKSTAGRRAEEQAVNQESVMQDAQQSPPSARASTTTAGAAAAKRGSNVGMIQPRQSPPLLASKGQEQNKTKHAVPKHEARHGGSRCLVRRTSNVDQSHVLQYPFSIRFEEWRSANVPEWYPWQQRWLADLRAMVRGQIIVVFVTHSFELKFKSTK
jgi:hypothetical protein